MQKMDLTEVATAVLPDPSAADATASEDKERAAERAVVKSVAVTAAIAQGMRPKAAPLLVERVVDLSSIPVRGGEPDEKVVAQAVNQALQEYPELRRGGSKYGSAPAVR
jgi:hypothetical protein